MVMDNDSGRILYENNSNERRLIASTTKIMTCILVLENSDLSKKITVGDEILKVYGTNIYVEVGEILTIKDLLYGLMLRSGNDAAIVLANNIFNSEDEFIHKMNDKAKEIGMNNTVFNNPHGLDEETKNYSTAYDMALLAKYAYKNRMYRNIISTKKYNTKSNLKSYEWYNRVELINSYKYSLGGKNGYTPKAGKTLVSYASKDNMNLMLVMGAIYGIVRIIGAVGLWKNRMWALVLSVINCVITMALMMFMLPAGIMDGILATTALILILTQYFGNKKIIE